MWFAEKYVGINWGLVISIFAATVSLCQQAEAAACRVTAHSWTAMIEKHGDGQTKALQRIYRTEGLSCYVGDVGTSFGPFQLHYGKGGRGNKSRGMGNLFTEQTGLHAQNRSSVPSQIRFMVRWGAIHGFSSDIWHGLRGGHAPHHFRHGHHAHHRHHWIHRHHRRA